jgi:hypothetical protein
VALSISPIARYAQNGTWVDDWGGRNGTPIGATFDTVNQKLGSGAGSYDGLDDYLQIDNLAAALATTTKGSWAGWVRPTVGVSAERLISFAESTKAEFLNIFNNSGTLRAQAYNGVTQWVIVTDNVVFSDTTWTHVGVVQDGILPVLYINGVAVAQTTVVSTDTTFWFNDFANLDQGALGCLNDLTGPRIFFDGLLDEILFFDDALIASDFTYLYNGGTGREISGVANHMSSSIYDKHFNAFKELNGKNTIV